MGHRVLFVLFFFGPLTNLYVTKIYNMMPGLKQVFPIKEEKNQNNNNKTKQQRQQQEQQVKVTQGQLPDPIEGNLG